jgi:predicted naringenin-chalcone synthase
MDQVTELIRELAEVNEKIWALPDDAFAEKYELTNRRDLLREQAATYAVDADKERSSAELLSELSGLRSQLGQIELQKIDLVTQAGGGAPGGSNMTNLGGVSLNAQMMEASGAGRIQSRIGVIKGVLTDRGVDVPTAE